MKRFEDFLINVKNQISLNPDYLGLCVAGSWITKEMDEFSDLDLILISKEKIAPDLEKMKRILITLSIELNFLRKG